MTTCPVCGTPCNIMGDPASVTRWYEPLGQGVIEAAVALDEGMPREGERMDFEPVFALIDAVRAAVAALSADRLPGVEGL